MLKFNNTKFVLLFVLIGSLSSCNYCEYDFGGEHCIKEINRYYDGLAEHPAFLFLDAKYLGQGFWAISSESYQSGATWTEDVYELDHSGHRRKVTKEYGNSGRWYESYRLIRTNCECGRTDIIELENGVTYQDGELIGPAKEWITANTLHFNISDARVGIFSKGMTIAEVYNLMPNEQIEKRLEYDEASNIPSVLYDIYYERPEPVMTLFPIEAGNSNSKISFIRILDDRFRTFHFIGLNSTFGDLKKYYPIEDGINEGRWMYKGIDKIEHNGRTINVYVKRGICFKIDATFLGVDSFGWMNEVDPSIIPDTTKFFAIDIPWESL
jgi:hypothetical protein